MKKLLVAAVFAAGLCGASFAAECDKKAEKLRAAEEELGMIISMIEGSGELSLQVEMLTYVLNDYKICNGKAVWCIKNKFKPKHKKLFKQKGLEWNEANIRAEYQRTKEAKEQAVYSCAEIEAAADEAKKATRKKDILN